MRDAFVEKKRWTHLVELDASGNNKYFKIRFTTSIPDLFGDLISSAVQNLRSSLDHATYASVVCSGLAKSKNALFPFGDDAHGFENVIKGRCKDIHPDIVAILRAFQPYKTGNILLWAINHTANLDKHALVIPVMGTFNSIIFGGPEDIPRPLRIIPPQWDPANNEIAYAVCAAEVTPHHTFHLAVDIGIGDTGLMHGEPALDLLRAMTDEVERVLMTIEGESLRLFPGAFS